MSSIADEMEKILPEEPWIWIWGSAFTNASVILIPDNPDRALQSHSKLPTSRRVVKWCQYTHGLNDVAHFVLIRPAMEAVTRVEHVIEIANLLLKTIQTQSFITAVTFWLMQRHFWTSSHLLKRTERKTKLTGESRNHSFSTSAKISCLSIQIKETISVLKSKVHRVTDTSSALARRYSALKSMNTHRVSVTPAGCTLSLVQMCFFPLTSHTRANLRKRW